MHLIEGFDYPLSRLDPFADHIDPPSVAVYETLMVKGPDGRAWPGLAERWRISGDGLTWRLQLRSGARYHSGDRCDASAVVAALEALRFGFHGGQQLWYWDPVDTVSAEGDETVVFHLHHPYSRLPSLLWGTHTAIHNEQRRANDPDGSGRDWADGTGPFLFESWDQERVVLNRWDAYPGSKAGFLGTDGRAPLQSITWISMLDPVARVDALERGIVHCIHGPEYEDVERLEHDERFNVVRFSQASNAYLALNWQCERVDFGDLRIRQAISLAVDREGLVDRALLGYGSPTIGPVSTDGEFYDPSVEQLRSFDIQASESLLNEAGWTRENGGIRTKDRERFAFECVVQDDAIHRLIAETLARQLGQVGIDMQIRPVLTFAGFYQACRSGPDSFINKWLWQDPVDASLGFISTRGVPDPNWQHASVPTLDDAFEGWLQADTESELHQSASIIQHLAAEHLPNLPLAVPHDVWVSNARVHEWSPAPSILYPFYHRTWIEHA